MNIALTTPPMGSKSPKINTKVKGWQRLLKKNGYYSGPIDGIAGTDTIQGFYRAKFHIGYPNPDHTAGDILWGYLSGTIPVTTVMKALAAKRKHDAVVLAAATPVREKALEWLIKNTGMKESPAGSNICAVSKWYGLIGAWCAMTGIMAYDESGSKTFTLDNAHKHNWAYVPNILADARRGINGLTITHDPLPGHGVCYDWPGESPGLADHYGTFEKWINKKAGTFYAREGNTAVGNDSNGGELMQRERSTSNVLNFVVINN